MEWTKIDELTDEILELYENYNVPDKRSEIFNLIRSKMTILSDFWYKKIGKMIDSEDRHGFYQLNERFIPKLQVLGFIEEKRMIQKFPSGFIGTYSDFFVTDLGRKAYKEWKNENQQRNH